MSYLTGSHTDRQATEVSRRQFLKNAAALSGGLTIAIYLPGCSKPEEAASTAVGKEVAANAWLHIDTDGAIKFLCDRSEMGQGVYTSLTTLIAEELGVEPKAIKVEFAPPGAEYGNSFVLGAQVTGGSTSVRDAWEKLRMAGAEARERLLAAGADRLHTSASLCRIVNNGVSAGNKTISFGEIAAAAGALPKPQNINLKQRDFKFIGTK
ncbi:MAG TPA: molybdopterin cofactor-binding domain-containing protein, partial [Steroidobacteraceae bacterium]|nr:molybdopterin cofactor-binding domain-containing protein [Steroidobacteraceae bacterium]